MSTVGDPLELALGSPDARLEDTLDLVDEAVERAAADGDGTTLQRLAERLDAVASQRGGEWRALGVAAARARSLAVRAGVQPEEPEVVAPAATPAPEFVYSGWWRRVFALLLDWLVLIIALPIVGFAIPDGDWLMFALGLAYFAVLPAITDGVTVGKGALGIAIRVDDGTKIGFGRASGRLVALLVLWVTVIGAVVDVITAGTDSKRQSIHDKIASTIVVRTRT